MKKKRDCSSPFYILNCFNTHSQGINVLETFTHEHLFVF